MSEGLKTIEEVALDLAKANIEAEPNISRVYLFPSDNEIRLIEVDRTSPSVNDVIPFYFGEDSEEGIPFPSGIALIHPDDVDKAELPEDWGEWSAKKLIWPTHENSD